jgi:hypothetical protein
MDNPSERRLPILKKINFEIEEANIINDDEKSSFSTAKIHAFSSGANRHRIECSADILRKTASTIYYKPILYSVNKNMDDFSSHNEPDRSLIAGFVLPDSAEFVEMPDGRIGMTVIAKIWKKYAPKVIQYFKRDPDKKKKASVELELYEYTQKKDGLIDMLEFAYQGICLIGDYITEASPGANAQILSFSKENEEYMEAFKQEFSEEGLTVYMPYQNREDMNKSLQGIDPPITPEQGEEIANQAESIGSDDEKNGWAIAISSFKDRHHVEDGHWVKNKEKENMSVEKNDDPEEDKKELEEKNDSNHEEQNGDQEEDKKEKNQETPEADMSCGKDNKQMDFELDFSVLLEGFEVESEPYKLLFAESQKENAERDYKVVYDLLFESLNNTKTELKEKNETISSLETEKVSFTEEITALKEFKTKIETQQKEFAVDSTLKESEEYIPKDELDQLKEDSVNYTLENIEAWKNAVRAKAFAYTKKEKGNDTIVRMGLPFGKDTKKHDSLWN